MPSGTVPGGDTTQPYQWMTIEDFTPGVYDYSKVATQTPIVASPQGAANQAGTWACIALPRGGLGPLPGVKNAYQYSPAFPGGATTLYVTMMTVNPALNNGDTEAIIGLEGDDGTHHYTIIYSDDLTTSSANLLRNAIDPTTPGIFGAPYPTWSRMIDNALYPSTVNVGAPVLAFPGAVLTDANTTSGHLFVYPSNGSNKVYPWGGTIASPGSVTFSLADLVTAGSEVSGQLIGYQNRLVTLSGIGYKWPISTFNVNEQVCFTDPPNSNVFGFQQTILGPENPFGYGCMGSISSGELFLVKKQGGGIVLTGDIFSPAQVTPYPGVMSTGDFYGKAGATRDGLVYCSQNAGAWVWNGGNTSTKISAQLDDDFFDCTTSAIASNNYGFFVQRWNDLVLFSNNYVFDTTTGSWWVLYPRSAQTGYAAGHTFFHFSPGVFENQMYASPISITGGAKQWITEFDATVPAQHYQWQSLSMKVSDDHLVDVRQVVVRASCPQAGGTVSVSLQSQAPTGAVTAGPYTTAAVTTATQEYRFNVSLLGAEQVVVILNADNTTGSNSAPIIHSVSFAYQETTHIPTSN